MDVTHPAVWRDATLHSLRRRLPPAGAVFLEVFYVLSSVEREFVIDNLLIRIRSIIEMILVDRPCAMGV